MSLVLFTLSLLIGIWLVRLIRNLDCYQPQPLKPLVLTTVIGGLISITIAIVVGRILNLFGLYQELSVLNFFVFTGPIEETAKLAGFLICLKLLRIRFDEPVDAIVYMSCVALGFSLIENLGYALRAPILLGIRSFTTTPMHIVFSATMALVFVANNRNEKAWKSLTKAVLIASFFHGLYDSLLLLLNSRAQISLSMPLATLNIFVTIMILSILWGKKVFGYALLNSPCRKNLVASLAEPTSTRPKKCAGCKKEATHNSYRFQKDTVEECQDCGCIILPEKEAVNFLNYYLPHYSALIGRNKELASKLKVFFVPFFDEKYKPHRRINVKEASPMIETFANDLRSHFEKSATFSFIFGTRPILGSENGIINEEYRGVVSSAVFKNTLTTATVVIGTLLGVVGFISLILKLLE